MWGGVSRWGGGSKGPSSKAPTFLRVGTPKCRSRCGMASRFRVDVSDATFQNATFPRSTDNSHVLAAAKLRVLGATRGAHLGEEHVK